MTRGSTKKAAPHQGDAGRLDLDWRGHIDGVDKAGDRRCSVTSDEVGWLLEVHGSAVNDEGTPYEWTRQELDGGHPVRHDSLDEALAAAPGLVVQFDAEHEASEEQRRLDESITAGTAPLEAYTVEQLRDKARERGVTGFSGATKGELIVMLEAEDEED